jgi:hypothetical protein
MCAVAARCSDEIDSRGGAEFAEKKESIATEGHKE